MTISTTTIKNSYSGDGSTTVFNYTFKITDQDHIEVLTRTSAGTESTKTITTDYTVSGVGNANGGSVAFTTAPAFVPEFLMFLLLLTMFEFELTEL